MKNKISQEIHTNNPWTTLDTHLVYDNAWMHVEESHVINPGGEPCVYGKICFKNEAVGIIPIDEDGNTWLVGQFRYTLNKWSWEIPMGGSPKQEATEKTAKRELQEETGLVAKTITQLLKLHPSNSITDEVGYVYLATGLSKGLQQLETSEQDIQVRKLPFDEVINMANNGEITDAISLAGIFYLALNKNKYL